MIECPTPAAHGLIDKAGQSAENAPMSRAEIEREIRALPREQALAIQDWLSDYLDDQASLQPEFLASIERGKADLREQRVRVEKH